MAPDRRFGLPHPLDADPSEDSFSPRKPGLWETVKRALGSTVPAEPPPAPPRPRIPAAPSPSSIDRAVSPVPAGARDEILSDVPFLEDIGPDVPQARPPSPEGLGEPPPTAVEPPPVSNLLEAAAPVLSTDAGEPSLSGPPLARGLASFSRDNAVREKKFAHLLRDRPGGEEKSPVPPKRRRR